MTQSLLAKPVVEGMQARIRDRAARFKSAHGRAPHLAVVLVGENPASQIYTKKKHETAISLGMESQNIVLPASSTPTEVKAVVDRLNADAKVDGILIQRPLPKNFNEEEVMYWVHPEKDVDAFHPDNVGRLCLGLSAFQPCTPAGVMEMLKHYGISVDGKIAAVIGRSTIVGKPMGQLLLQANATVYQCHSRTPNLAAVTRQADLVVVAIGRANFLKAEHLKPGAVVIDVGINRVGEKKVVGDADFEDVSKVAGAVSPVPGGVGPMTISMLLQNTCWAAERRTRKDS